MWLCDAAAQATCASAAHTTGNVTSYLLSTSADVLKQRSAQPFNWTADGRTWDMHAHLTHYVHLHFFEFNGRSELGLYHALLVMLLRRRLDVELHWPRFRRLWAEHGPFLRRDLSTRWLASACSTFIDYSDDRIEAAIATAGMLFAQTIKLYETERWALNEDAFVRTSGAGTASLTTRPVHYLHNWSAQHGFDWPPPVELLDGWWPFNIGRGDLIKNMHLRVRHVTDSNSHSSAASILNELLTRASVQDTVLHRFKNVHTNPLTAWSQ